MDMMDADAAPDFDADNEEWDGTEEMRKRKLDEYMNELYGMEFNDIVRISIPSCSSQLLILWHRLTRLPIIGWR